ncbi:Domain of uncharacterised function (DUF3560) [Mycobacteroides abscessus subsp. bolletii]|uniref:DUF3560 domain-containing protein n=1 Tax=Mycobacteroides abscessus TaxID=36809 RepID=UPI0009D21519|nr:DUF3560 domain-containing protein [Mycobacteroides abscessus]SKY96173.1 Domain of uncharacterised function (DUF3560) [Mycobacteroides abscessus subsp. bolletii]
MTPIEGNEAVSLTISHTHAEGTLIVGTSRGDGSAEVLKTVLNPYSRARAWRWSRNLGSWYVQRSRDARANMPLIEGTKAALEAAGFVVTVQIDDDYRSTRDVEADRVARQEQRVAALSDKAERKASAADAAWEAEKRAVQVLPPDGQPIMVGHHSESRHRKLIERAHSATRRAIDATDEAAAVADRASSAAFTTQFRHSPNVIRRRIDRLEAELRRYERARDGHTRTLFTDANGVKHVDTFEPAAGQHRERVLAEIDRFEDQIAYWNGELVKAAESGAQLWSAETVQVGDRVQYWSNVWGTVRRVNAKSVGLEKLRGRLPYDQIKAVQDSAGRTVRLVAGARTVAVE